jgi:hypothetical protein
MLAESFLRRSRGDHPENSPMTRPNLFIATLAALALAGPALAAKPAVPVFDKSAFDET